LVHIGTSSFSSKDWIGTFYPKGTKPAEFLNIYSKAFDSVEIDSTYYAIPSIKTVGSWVARVPEDFKICAKFPRSLVHGGKDSQPDGKRILSHDGTYKDRDKFLEAIGALKERAGPLLIQFPYFSKNVFTSREVFFEILDQFLEDLPEDFRYAVEIRNRNWLKPAFADLCRRHNAALALTDQAWMPHGDEIEQLFDPVTTDFTYIRLLGDRKAIEAVTKTWGEEVIDNTERMKRWAAVLQRLADRAVESYVFANNHYSGHAPSTARRLRDMVFDNAG
jgi:uncharacterized protein YecE (DUF72 family)